MHQISSTPSSNDASISHSLLYNNLEYTAEVPRLPPSDPRGFLKSAHLSSSVPTVTRYTSTLLPLQMNGLGLGFSSNKCHCLQIPEGITALTSSKVACLNYVVCTKIPTRQIVPSNSTAIVKKENIKQTGKREHHLWMKKDSAMSGQMALKLVRVVSEVSNEKETVYAALDKWTAWETEFPLIAAAKALRILQKRNQWLHLIQVGKWMLSKGQGLTMGTYNLLLLAFDMDQRVEEAESLWNMIVSTHTRSVSKRLFSRIISLYDHHNLPNKIIEVFTDMEELGVKPDEDTVKKVARAFRKLGEESKQKLVLRKYLNNWKYIHHNGERVKVRRWG